MSVSESNNQKTMTTTVFKVAVLGGGSKLHFAPLSFCPIHHFFYYIFLAFIDIL